MRYRLTYVGIDPEHDYAVFDMKAKYEGIIVYEDEVDWEGPDWNPDAVYYANRLFHRSQFTPYEEEELDCGCPA